MNTNENTLERLENLSREKQTNGIKVPDIRKLKLSLTDVEKSYNAIYSKYSKYFKSKIDECLEHKGLNLWTVEPTDLECILDEVLHADILNYAGKYTDSEDELQIARYFSKDKLTNAHYPKGSLECWEFEYYGYNDVVEVIGIPIPRKESELLVSKKSRKSIYFTKGIKSPNKTKILALEDICAYIYLLETAYNKFNQLFLENNNKYKPMYFNYFFDNAELTNEDILSVYSIERPINIGWHSRYGQALISEIFFYLKEEAEDEYLENEFNKKLSDDYAKSYQDLKNPTDKIIEKMKNNPFNKYFSKIEIDSDVDLEKFQQSEIEWVNFINTSLKSLVKLPVDKPTLRFRKLGQHNATGLYYPSVNCICVDIRDVSSFIHELGHCIDYTATDIRLSKQYEFKRVIKEYKYAFEKGIKELEKEGMVFKLSSKKESYFYNPTEVFARCLELYLGTSKELNSSFLPKEFKLNGGYPTFKGSFSNEVNNYFDMILEKFNINIQNKISTLKLVSEDDVKLASSTNNSIKKEVKTPATKNINEHFSGDYIFLTKDIDIVSGTIFINSDFSFKNRKTEKENINNTSENIYNTNLDSDEAAILNDISTESYEFLTKEMKEGTSGSVFLKDNFSFKENKKTLNDDKVKTNLLENSKINTGNKKNKYTLKGSSTIEDGILTDALVYNDKKNKNQYSLFDLM